MKTKKNTSNIIEINKPTRKPRITKQTDEERFRANVGKPDSNGCECWNSTTFSNGYGQFNANGIVYYAHRYAWQLANKQTIPTGKYVLHSCDNKRCCAAAHLRLGDAKANALDKVERNRTTLGRKITRRVFTEAEINKIIELAATGHTQYRIAKLTLRTDPVIAGVLKRNAEAIAEKRVSNAKAAIANILDPLNKTLKAAVSELQAVTLFKKAA